MGEQNKTASDLVEAALAEFPINLDGQSFRIGGGPLLQADDDEVFYSRKKANQIFQALFDHLKGIKAALAAQQAPAQPPAKVVREGLTEAQNLARAIFEREYLNDPHYSSGEVVWECSDDLLTVLTQIDNMVSGMKRIAPEQASPKMLTAEEVSSGYFLADVAPTDEPMSLFEAGARFAERSHGIGIPATGGEGASNG